MIHASESSASPTSLLCSGGVYSWMYDAARRKQKAPSVCLSLIYSLHGVLISIARIAIGTAWTDP